MKKFIPRTNEELINKMKKEKFKGEYKVKDDIVAWYISKEVKIEIILNNIPDEAYISYYVKIDNKVYYMTHEHPLMDEIYEVLLELNKETNMLVVKKSIFGKVPRLYFSCYDDFNEKKFSNKKKYDIYKF